VSFEHRLLLGIAFPAMVAAVVMAVGVWRRRAWAGALGVAAGYVAGHLFIQGLPHQPPIAAEDWLPALAFLAAVVGWIDANANPPKRARWLIRLLTVMAMVLLLTRPMIRYAWTTIQTVAWLAGMIAAMAAIWAAVDTTARRRPGPLVPLILGTVTAALAVVQALSSSIVLARFSGAAAVSVVPLALLAWRRPKEGLVLGALPVMLVLFYGTLMAGFFYSEVSRGSALLLALSPLSARLSDGGKRPWIGAVLAAASIVGALGIAVTTATPFNAGP
jgi:hypothetical protein